jgi:Family of unknown function (DUF6011)
MNTPNKDNNRPSGDALVAEPEDPTQPWLFEEEPMRAISAINKRSRQRQLSALRRRVSRLASVAISPGEAKRIGEILGRMHAGENLQSTHCRICSRELTDPESVRRGIGPVCWQKLEMIRCK